jgi:hypothetical protein
LAALAGAAAFLEKRARGAAGAARATRARAGRAVPRKDLAAIADMAEGVELEARETRVGVWDRSWSLPHVTT